VARRSADDARKRSGAADGTPVVRLVWIGGSHGAMQLVNIYMHVSAILST